MNNTAVMDVTTKVLETIQQHSNETGYLSFGISISPDAILYTYGSTDEFRVILSDLEEAYHIQFESDEIGEMTVRAFIDMVINKVKR